MSGFNEKFRFCLPIVLLGAFVCVLAARLSMLHFGREVVKQPSYRRTVVAPALRGGIFPARGDCAFACSVPVWSYYADPAALMVKKGDKGHTRQELVAAVAKVMDLPEEKVKEAFFRTKSRYNFLLTSFDGKMHEALITPPDKKSFSLAREAGLSIEERQVRMYPQGRRLSHVVGFVSKDPTNRVGAAGVELKYEKYLHGIPGLVEEYRDAHGRAIYDLPPVFSAAPQNGCDVFLTVDQNVQFDVENALAEGVKEHRAQAGWAIVMDVKTGAVLAMANYPDYEPSEFNKHSEEVKNNRAITVPYEPGSVMKTITACAYLNEGLGGPDTVYSTAYGDPRYSKLPTDSHAVPPQMTVQDALVHSVNVVYGKIGVDVGPRRLHGYMRKFGFGERTGIELPAETPGQLLQLSSWLKDVVKWSRAPIGHGISVSAIQMASAYATIANDGKRMRPYVVDHVVSAKGDVVFRHEPEVVDVPIRPEVARQVRKMLVGVATPQGTARRAAVKGYSVAGKTGTGQMLDPDWVPPADAKVKKYRPYSKTLFNSSFVGMIPADDPKIVILVTLHKPEFCRSQKKSQESGLPINNHQGGVCAAPTFRAIAEKVVRYLGIPPDHPEELPEEETEKAQ